MLKVRSCDVVSHHTVLTALPGVIVATETFSDSQIKNILLRFDGGVLYLHSTVTNRTRIAKVSL